MDQIKLLILASQWFRNYNLYGWAIEFRKYGLTLASCDYNTQTIRFNDYYVEYSPELNVLKTLKHELAHALVGPGHGHDEVWKTMAEKLGSSPRATSDEDAVIRPGKYRASCPNCGRVYDKYRLPKYVRGYYCPRCGKEAGQLRFSRQVKAASR